MSNAGRFAYECVRFAYEHAVKLVRVKLERQQWMRAERVVYRGRFAALDATSIFSACMTVLWVA